MKKLNTSDIIIIVSAIILGLTIIIFRKKIFTKSIKMTSEDTTTGTTNGGGAYTPPISNSNLDFDKTLKKGSSGLEVQMLQRLLIDDGQNLGNYGTNGDGVDGQFGAKTEAALLAVKSVKSITLNKYLE